MSTIQNFKCSCGATLCSNTDNTESDYNKNKSQLNIEYWLETHRKCSQPLGMITLEKGQKFEPIIGSKKTPNPFCSTNAIFNESLKDCPTFLNDWLIKEITEEWPGKITVKAEYCRK